MKKTALLLSVLCLLVSCKVEFSPNAEWQEIPAVYCVLDQDDDTSYVRVQKCYLGNSNAYDDATIFDSINYPEGSLTVLLQEWQAKADSDSILHAIGDAPRKTYTFTYKMATDKDSGMFAYPGQPIYFCETKGQLDSSCLYKLVILKNDNGDTLATATTQLIWGIMELLHPHSNTTFNFTSRGSTERFCLMKFSALQGGRRYQPMIRFYYRNFIVNENPDGTCDTTIIPHSFTFDAGFTKSNMRDDTIEYAYSEGAFLESVYKGVKDDPYPKNVIDTVDIYIRVCNEDLSQYIYTHELNGSINQTNHRYTNIVNGNPALPAVGIFAARRMHLMFIAKTPANSNSVYKKALDSLHVGFGGCW